MSRDAGTPGLGTTPTQNAFYASTYTKATKMAQPTRFGRIPTKNNTMGRTRNSPFSYRCKKKPKKTDVQVLETRAASPHAPPVIHELANEPHAPFTLPIRVGNEPFKVHIKAQDPLSLFMYFFGGFEALSVVCAAINTDTEKSRRTVNSNETPRP
jgi:hypothetical protein